MLNIEAIIIVSETIIGERTGPIQGIGIRKRISFSNIDAGQLSKILSHI